MTLERVMFGRVSDKVADERQARKSVLRGFAIQALDALVVGSDLYQVRDKINELHPLNPEHWWESKTNATPKEVWQTLVVLQLEDIPIKCETVVQTDRRSGRQTARFLWSRSREE